MTELVFGVNVPPLFIQSPLMVKVFDPDMVKIAPELIVIFLQVPPAAPIAGWFPPEGIVTSVVEVGTVELHQFEVVFQSVFVFPFQVPAIQEAVTFNSPVAEAPK